MALNIYSKESTDDLLDAKLDLAGGTMTGGLTLSASGIIFSDSTYLTTAPAGSTVAADQLTAGVVTTNPTTGPTTSGDVLQYDGTGLIWAAGGGGGGVAWGAITGTVTDQTDLVSYISGLGYQTASDVSTYASANYYPLSSNPAGYLTSVPGKTVNNIDMGVANYSLALSDANNIVNVSAGDGSLSGYAIIIPAESSVAFPVGTVILLTVSIYGSFNYVNGDSGVTVIQSANMLNYGMMRTAIKLGSDLWMISSQI